MADGHKYRAGYCHADRFWHTGRRHGKGLRLAWLLARAQNFRLTGPLRRAFFVSSGKGAVHIKQGCVRPTLNRAVARAPFGTLRGYQQTNEPLPQWQFIWACQSFWYAFSLLTAPHGSHKKSPMGQPPKGGEVHGAVPQRSRDPSDCGTDSRTDRQSLDEIVRPLWEEPAPTRVKNLAFVLL